MSHATSHPVRCAHGSCDASHPGGKWGNIRAARDGWFESRSGESYCPKHVPKWVKRWRNN